ncbi:hypothetical protein Tcan_16182 [Toxocara canis]|uniref:Chondroitin proteoglycan 4 domain-containing protein n=1 Tax=Toxocara canis TaxID=6265 RepID=A0A0B2VRA8_TOXCA|nr:hypothetical protein Tcan_16182 [Toxocara canis]
MMMTFSCGRNARRIVTTCALFTLLNTSNATVIDDISNLINLFNFSPQKGCLDECVTPLLIAVYDMVAYGNSRTHFADLCIEYSLALSCFESKAERCKANVELFKVLTSGLHVACDAERSIFDSAFACVDVFKDKPLSECERSCHLYGGLRDWTSSSYLKTLGKGGEALLSSLRYAGPFCSGLSCYLSCSQNHLNYMCGEEGEKILEIFTRPVRRLSYRYRTASLEVKTLLKNITIPDECAKIVSTGNEDQLLFGEGILRDVDVADFLDVGLETDDMKEKGKIVDYFDLSMLNIEKEDLEANGLKHGTQSVAQVAFTMVFVGLVLFVTLVGLIITVMWCLITTRKSQRKIRYALRFVTPLSPSMREISAKSPIRFLSGSKEK